MISLADETPALQQGLEEFEASFVYPLDAEQTFRISHGPDYQRFFKAMGETRCFVARDDSAVQGVLTTVRRELLLPGGQSKSALYVCDLKVSAGPARAATFLRLASAARNFHESSSCESAFSIVMRGNERLPDQYTGAWGLPLFELLAEVAILRIPVQPNPEALAKLVSPSDVADIFAGLESDAVRTSTRPRSEGARFEPLGLLSSSQRACGILEDTLTSKRLFTGDQELLSAHLSSFAYATPADGAQVVSTALSVCRERGIPALFLALPAERLNAWLSHNSYPNATVTGATIYGLGIPPGLPWNINTSEV